MRMLRTVNRIDWRTVGRSVFVTLTYPDQFIERTYKARTQQRSLMNRYIEKFAKRKVGIVWRCEWKSRRSGQYKGKLVPHFHLLVCGVAFLPQARVREWWRTILGATGALATDVRAITGEEGAAMYLTKYMAKVDTLDRAAYLNNPYTMGRQWGLSRSKQIPRAKITVNRDLDEEETAFAQFECAKDRPRYNPLLDGGFTLFGNEVEKEFTQRLGKRT